MSGQVQEIARCPRCRAAVRSHYAGARPAVAFVRMRHLDQLDHLPPEHPHLRRVEAAMGAGHAEDYRAGGRFASANSG